ncbi:MAG: hypothetical protein HC806_02180 [Anaerolineae bacterium]|nr:hypothetical protein [Anaerolineae bacterium]
MHGLENEYGDQMTFTYLDIDDPANKELMQELAYVGRPYFVLLDGEGNQLYKWSGYVPGADLRAKFDEALN